MVLRWILALVLLCGLLLAAALLALRSESTLLRAITWSVATFTDYELELVSARADLFAGTVEAQQLHLHHVESEGAALVSVLNLQGSKILLGDLLLLNLKHAVLTADSVSVYVKGNDQADDPKPITWLSYLSWLPDRANIGTVHVINHHKELMIFPLQQVRGYRGAYNNFIATATGLWEGNSIETGLELNALRDEGSFFGVGMTADLSAAHSGSQAVLTGEFTGTDSDYQYNFSLQADTTQIEDALARYPQIAKRLTGDLSIEGRLKGDSEEATLTADRIILQNLPAYGFEASGDLSRNFAEGKTHIQLNSAGQMASLRAFNEFLNLELDGLGSAQSSLRLTGTLGDPEIERFILQTRSDSGLSLNLSGSVSRRELSDGTLAPFNELMVDVSAPGLAPLRPWLGEISLDTGPWAASATITGNREALAVSRFLVTAGTPDTITFGAEGAVNRIAIDDQEFELDDVTGISAAVTTETPDSQYVAELLGITLPDHHAMTLSLQLSGDGPQLQASEGALVVSASDFDASLTEMSMSLLSSQERWLMQNFKGKLAGALSDTSALSQYTTTPAVSLGPISYSADIVQANGRVSARNIQAAITGEQVTATATGEVEDLVNLSGVRIAHDFSGVSTSAVLSALVARFSYSQPIGTLDGSFDLSGDAGDLALTNIEIRNSDYTPLGFTAGGDIDDLASLHGSFTLSTRITDLDLLYALTGFEVKQTSLSASFSSQDERTAIDVDGTVGQSTVEGSGFYASSDDGITAAELAFSSPHLRMADLGLQASAANRADNAPAEQLGESAESGLDRLLTQAPRFPSRLKIDIDQLSGDATAIDSLALEMTGRDGAYTLRQLDARYATGELQLRGIIDLNQQPINLSLAGQGLSIPLNRVATDIGLESDIEGVLSFRGGLTGRGTTEESLRESLDGSLSLALEDATIAGAAYDVLATGLLEWLYSGAALADSTRLDCTMARLDFDDGVAYTDNILVESQRMIAEGEAELDLVNRNIDLVLVPRSKSRTFQIPSRVTVRGPLESPRTTVSPISAVADASAEALTLLPKIAMRLFGIKPKDGGNSHPCGT